MFKVMDGNPDVVRYLHHFDSYTRCEDMLKWLIKNKLTGNEFIHWAKNTFGVYYLAVGKFILEQLNKDDSYKILHGRDFL